MIEAALAASQGRIAGPSGAATKLGLPSTLVELRLAANLDRVFINQLQKGAKDNGRVRFFPCGDKLDPDIIRLQTVEPDTLERKFLAQAGTMETPCSADRIDETRPKAGGEMNTFLWAVQALLAAVLLFGGGMKFLAPKTFSKMRHQDQAS